MSLAEQNALGLELNAIRQRLSGGLPLDAADPDYTGSVVTRVRLERLAAKIVRDLTAAGVAPA